MARYTGPKTRIARKFGEAIFGDDKSFEKRNYPPGQHGMAKKRGKKSEYAIQLMEKQKAKYSYGILEKQFRNLFEKAAASKGVTGEILLQKLLLFLVLPQELFCYNLLLPFEPRMECSF